MSGFAPYCCFFKVCGELSLADGNDLPYAGNALGLEDAPAFAPNLRATARRIHSPSLRTEIPDQGIAYGLEVAPACAPNLRATARRMPLSFMRIETHPTCMLFATTQLRQALATVRSSQLCSRDANRTSGNLFDTLPPLPLKIWPPLLPREQISQGWVVLCV